MKVVDLVLLVALTLTTIMLFYGFRPDWRALSFEYVHGLRSEIALSGAWGYVVNWLMFLLWPFCMAFYLYRRRWSWFVVAVIGQLIMYLTFGNKTTLLSIGLIVPTVIMVQRYRSQSSLPKLYTLVLAFAVLIFVLVGNVWPLALVPVRLFHIPAQISFQHHDFFSTNERLYFVESFIGRLSGRFSPYGMQSGFLIAAVNGAPGSQSNTGFLGDAYANAGFAAMVLFSVFFALLLLTIDSFAVHSKSKNLYAALTLYHIVVLNDRALLTSLISSGLLFHVLLMYLLVSEEHVSPAVCEPNMRLI